MVLIIGGAYQGKLDYAKNEYELTDEDVFTCDENSTAVGFDEKVIDHFERYILALIKAGQVPERAVGMQIRAGRYKNKIIICDDISQGLVPMDKTERAWREGVGRTMVKVSEQADKVVRLFCGIPEILKDDSKEEAPAPKTDGLEAVFAAKENGAVEKTEAAAEGAKDAAEKPSETAAPAPHGGRQAAKPRSPFGNGSVALPHKQNAGDDGSEEGLTPEEQFRKMFAKMQEERKAAKEKK